MNMCTRAPELTGEELVAARGNVAKFEPVHGWGSDKRHIEQLTTGELYSLIEWLRSRNANLSTGVKAQAKDVYAEGVQAGMELGTCRFNCRTAKENFIAGVDAGTKRAGDYYLGTPDREAMYDEYTQKKA